MINIILFGSFFVMLFLNIPICVSLGLSSIFAMLYSGDKLSIVPTNVYNGMAKFLLLAIPFFVLSGNIMAKAGISTRLVQFIDDCIGHRRGGIAIVCVVVACFFGAISGSGPATVAALGIILIPAMINRGGFSAPFSSAMMATAITSCSRATMHSKCGSTKRSRPSAFPILLIPGATASSSSLS